MKKEFVRNPYNYDSDQVSEETGLACRDESRTQQQYVEESDINYIAEKFMRTGEMPLVLHMPTSGDFTGIFDFQEAMNLINDARAEFMKLPAKLRSRFDNDPAKLINFLDDPANRDEAIGLGLIAKKENDNGSSHQGSTQERTQDAPGSQRTAATEGKNEATQKP